MRETVQELEMANAEIIRLGQSPPSCLACPRRQELLDKALAQLQANAAEIVALRGQIENLAAAASNLEARLNQEIAKHSQLSQQVTEAGVSITRLTHQGTR